VIEAKDDYNISRGFLFTYAIPYTHTGVKWDKAWGDAFTTMLGVVNGWDNLQDNNKGKTLHAGVGLLPKEKISLTVSGTYGPEQTTPVPPTPSTEKNSRSVVDTILKVSPTDKLTLIANHDWGIEEGLVSAQADNTTYNWQGLALYAVYGFTDDTSAALRWETFDDEGELSNQSRLGLNQPVVLHSLTATLQRKHNGVIYRLEYRQDDATRKVFFDNKTLPDDTQSTVGAQIIYAF
ncbi:MAG TPA: outer membrane beta-barrel protein, partial [Elusimicrobiota bacterium]|nr:outer membrane beta-barrel protein [Elusimicrobiota bacterium]